MNFNNKFQIVLHIFSTLSYDEAVKSVLSNISFKLLLIIDVYTKICTKNTVLCKQSFCSLKLCYHRIKFLNPTVLKN